MDCLQGMDNILHYLCLLRQANKCFGISPCFPSSAGSADGHGGESEQVVHLYNYTDLVWNKCADGTGGIRLLMSVHPQVSLQLPRVVKLVGGDTE